MKQSNSVSDLTELESGHVFGMRSAHDIFRKLCREKQRFESAGSDNAGRNNQVDAAVNFAITAWHITDWVWRRQEHELCKSFRVRSFREFQNEMRRQCPDLAVCDIIANAAKHGGAADKRRDRPGLETVLVAEPVAGGAAGVELIAELTDRRWSLNVRVDGKSQDLASLLASVFLFWHKFIQRHCVTVQAS